MDGCEGADLDELIRGLGFETIPTTTHQNVVLVDPSAGCARSGQGANADMWIIRFHGDRAVFVPTPDDFSGWLFSVGPSVRHGYPDIVLGWHLGGADTAISCFRFDGKSYYTRKTQNCFPTATTTGRSRQRTK